MSSSSYLQIHRNVDICSVFQNDIASRMILSHYRVSLGSIAWKMYRPANDSQTGSENDLRTGNDPQIAPRAGPDDQGKVWWTREIGQWI